MYPTITTFTELEAFFKWKTEGTFKFNWLSKKTTTEYTIFFQKKISWDYKYIYFLNNIQIWWYKDKEELVKAIKGQMTSQGFKSSTDSENIKEATTTKSSFDDIFEPEVVEEVDVKKEVARFQEMLNYFISWNWKLTQVRENRWTLTYKFLQVDAIYKEYSITYYPNEWIFTIWWSWITWTKEQFLLDLIVSEKYRNNIINRYEAMVSDLGA